MRLVNRLWAVLVFTSACASGPAGAPFMQPMSVEAPTGVGKGAAVPLADTPPPAADPAAPGEATRPPEKDGQFIRALPVNEGLRATTGSGALPPQDNPRLMLGRGIDFITLEAKGDCVVRTAPQSGGGSEAFFSIDQITSHEELSNKMDVSASAALRFSLLKGGSLKMKYVEERKVSHYATYVLVRAIVRAAPINMLDLQIKPEYASLLKKPAEFRRKCGDEFIVGYISGGEFYGVVEIESSTQEEQKTVQGELSAKIGVFSTAATFDKNLRKIVESREVKIVAYQGGSAPQIFEPTPDGLVKAALAFPATFYDGGKIKPDALVISNWLTMKYDVLPTDADAAPQMSIDNQLDMIERMGRYRQVFSQRLDDIDRVLLSPTRFVTPDLPDLKAKRTAIGKVLGTVLDGATTCFRDFTSCKMPENLDIVDVTLPPLKSGNLCDKPIYNERQEARCGVKSYVSQRDPACGVELYNQGTGAACGAATYVTSRSAKCGVEAYVTKKDASCPGSTPGGEINCMMKKPGDGDRPCKQTKPYLASCSKPEFGVERYKECAHPSHGAQTYKSCANASFGIYAYKECARPAFGIKDYQACRRPEFGVERCEKP